MVLANEFEQFDARIRPDDANLEACRDAHRDLRARLQADPTIKEIRVADFLQGSYARNTILEASDKNDVDVILVTSLDEKQFPNPEHALNLFTPFLEANYKGQYEPRGRSINIQLDEVELDLVPTSAPSEARRVQLRALQDDLDRMVAKAMPADDMPDPDEIIGTSGPSIHDGDWAIAPLRIPDRHAKCWQDTHPLATLAWTTEKNARCKKRFLRIVRAVKWWRKHVSGGPKHPKSYPIEHMVGDYCPTDVTSVAEGVTATLERMLKDYEPYLAHGKVPWLDPRGLEGRTNNVLSLVTLEDFRGFVEVLRTAARDARRAFDFEGDPHEAGILWSRVLGDRFPIPPSKNRAVPSGGFTPQRGDPNPQPVGGRFA